MPDSGPALQATSLPSSPLLSPMYSSPYGHNEKLSILQMLSPIPACDAFPPMVKSRFSQSLKQIFLLWIVFFLRILGNHQNTLPLFFPSLSHSCTQTLSPPWMLCYIWFSPTSQVLCILITGSGTQKIVCDVCWIEWNREILLCLGRYVSTEHWRISYQAVWWPYVTRMVSHR